MSGKVNVPAPTVPAYSHSALASAASTYQAYRAARACMRAGRLAEVAEFFSFGTNDLTQTALGLSRDEIYIMNVLKCRPEGNRDPLPEEVAACRRLFDQQLAIIGPRVILALGRFAPTDLVGIDRAQFIADGLILDGMRRGVGVSIFTILLMGLVAGLERAGIMDRVVGAATRGARTPRQAEWRIFATISAAVILTTHDMDDIEELCERVIIIDKGTLLYDGKLDKLKKSIIDSKTVEV